MQNYYKPLFNNIRTYMPGKDEQTTGKKNSRHTLLSAYVYDILRRKTAPAFRMTQKDIIATLERAPYNLSVERKALSRTLQVMEQEGIGVHCSNNGVWFDAKSFL